MSLRLSLEGRAGGISFLALFGAVWLALAGYKLGLPLAAVFYVVAVVGAVIWLRVAAAWRKAARLQPEPSAEGLAAEARKDKWFYWVLGAEGLLLFLNGNLLVNLHLLAFIWPSIALIVGLHFYPLAYAFRLPVYYATATFMCVLAVGVMACIALAPGFAAQETWDALVGVGSGLVLWGSCAYIWLQVRKTLTK